MFFVFLLNLLWSCITFIFALLFIDFLASISTLHTAEHKSSKDTKDTDSETQTGISSVNTKDSDVCITEELDEEYWLDNITKLLDVNRTMLKYYTVNGSVFMDGETTIADDEYHQYTLYKVAGQKPSTMWDESDDEDSYESLSVVYEVVKNGRIINSNVFITHEQWNTIRQIQEDLYSCAVCELQCDAASVAGHMSSDTHEMYLERCRPLKKFDLSITRMIGDNLHCAVCNSVYPFAEYRTHESSKEHEGNLLFAINKVSDISHLHSGNDVLSIDRNNIQPPNNQPGNKLSNEADKQYSDNGRVNRDQYATSSRDQNTTLNSDHNNFEVSSQQTTLIRDQVCIPMAHRDRNASTISGQYDTPMPNSLLTMPNRGQSPTMPNRGRSPTMPKWGQSPTMPNRVQSPVSNRDLHTSDMPNRVQSPMSNRNLHTSDMPNSVQSPMSNRDLHTPAMPNRVQSPMPNRVQSPMSNSDQLTERENSFFTRDEIFGAYSNIKIYDDDFEMDEYVPPIEGISYASMASRPTVRSPKYLKIDLGDKVVRVKFEYWHMITQTDLNKYYCMACQSAFQIRFKQIHCTDSKHEEMLAKCSVVAAFEDYLIRNVSDKLYHCGHCNNLQVKNDIQVHVEKYHPKSNRIKPINMDMTRDIQSIQLDTKTRNNEAKVQVTNTRFNETIPNVARNVPTIDIFGEFKFSPFGSEMTVSNLACHTLMLVNNLYICALCDAYIQGDLIGHVYEITHVQLMNMTPFIKPFECHLTRAVRGSLHCALCNILIPVNRIYDHNIENSHTAALAKALGMTRNQRPHKEVKYKFDEATDTKTDLNKLINSPTSLALLSNIKITNPSGETLNPNPAYLNTPELTPVNNLLNPIPKFQLQEQVVSLNIDKPDNPPIQLKIAVDSNSQVRVQPVDSTDVDKGVTGEMEIVVKNDEIRKDILFDSDEDEVKEFELDKIVLIKMKSAFYKIYNASYHTLIHVGNGTRYCFVCSNTLSYGDLMKHVDSREHVDNIAKNKFLSNFFGVQLFRQMYLMYHCAVCNVVMTRKEVKMHTEWPKHAEKYENACKKLGKKLLKDIIKSGAKEITADTQKEHVYLKTDAEPTFSVVTYIQSTKVDFVEPFIERKLVRKSRMVILQGNVMKIGFESWHGVVVAKNGAKCILCQEEMNLDEWERHIDTKYHNIALGITFEKQFYPALIRKINESTVNCVICNLELASDESLIHEHVHGRKHDKNYKAVIRTSNSDSYTDCYEDPLTL